MTAIALSLVSHTNVGKTTLARTLLGRDVGEVRDAPHVTEFADPHVLLRAGDDVLTLWDTPGFGDSARLVRRLNQSNNPLGWFLSQMWDRWRDRPFWASQQVMRHVRDTSDVVLYLVNAAERPETAGYVAPEMELLAWVGKPVLVLLNQLGPPRSGAADAEDLQHWAEHLRRWPLVRAVLPLDAFARCWVQEGVLWRAVHEALPAAQQPAMATLQQAWQQQRQQVFDESMQALAGSLARLSALRLPLEGGGMAETLRRLGSALGLAKEKPAALDRAEAELAAAITHEVRGSTETLIRLHGLAGQATGVVLERLAEQVQWRRKVDEGPAALIGGVLSGAATGLATDVATGGLTLGGGMLAGGLLGALGAAGMARGLNIVRGTDRSWVSLGPDALQALLQAALLRYLAVAHFGRGRGQWQDGEAPPHWPAAVQAALATAGPQLAALWPAADAQPAPAAPGAATPTDTPARAAALKPLLAGCTDDVLARLYPGAWPPPSRSRAVS